MAVPPAKAVVAVARSALKSMVVPRLISIVIPVRNEASRVAMALAPLQVWRQRGHEIIVVDGASTDASAAIAAPLCDCLIRTTAGRAAQMNAGAALARGDLLLFLHLDTALPSEAGAALDTIGVGLCDYWGRFDVRLDAPGPVYRIIESMMNWRSRVTGIATGDQAIFVSRDLFNRGGGFPRIALMEDIALSRVLGGYVQPICLSARVTTSTRRWQRDGVAATILKMWCLRAAFFIGVSPDRLLALYDRSTTLTP